MTDVFGYRVSSSTGFEAAVISQKRLTVVGNQDPLEAESAGLGEFTGCFRQRSMGLSSTGIRIPHRHSVG